MNKKEIIERLELFNGKVEELGNSSFISNWDSKSIFWNTITSNLPTKFLLPNDEQTKAFILTLRFFMQDNEPISLRNISKIYSSELIEKEFQEEFDQKRKILNTYLNLDFRSNGITNRDILEAFIYGNYAHSDQKDKYSELVKTDIKHRLNAGSFYSIANSFFTTLQQFQKLNKKVLRNLRAT